MTADTGTEQLWKSESAALAVWQSRLTLHCQSWKMLTLVAANEHKQLEPGLGVFKQTTENNHLIGKRGLIVRSSYVNKCINFSKIFHCVFYIFMLPLWSNYSGVLYTQQWKRARKRLHCARTSPFFCPILYLILCLEIIFEMNWKAMFSNGVLSPWDPFY